MIKKFLFIIIFIGLFLGSGGDSSSIQQESARYLQQLSKAGVTMPPVQPPQSSPLFTQQLIPAAAPGLQNATPSPAPDISVRPSTNSNPAGRKVAYITIDDGPSANNTPKNLDTLRRYNIKATFFVLPKEGLDDIYKRILDEGHAIGNHSYSHNSKPLYSDINFFENDLLRARKLIQDKLGYTTTLYRFPGGTFGKNKAAVEERVKILEKYGYRYFNWDVTTGDSDTGPAGKNVTALVNNVLNNTRGRSKLIVLMHDSPDRVTTTEALPLIIEGLRSQGYTFDVLTNY